MTRYLLTTILSIVALLAHSSAAAQTEPCTPAKATLADFAWLVGAWTGTGLGGVSQETWSPPAGGAMMGMFRQVEEGRIVFYELLTLVERDGTVALRLKHFNADLTGWEEKGQVLEFPLLEVTPTTAVFDAMTFTVVSPDRFTVRLLLRDKASGNQREELFEYTRARPSIVNR